MEGNLRGSDVLIRWGGEEFLAILPETKAEDAGALAETLRALLARTRFPIQEQVTASLGVTEYRFDESPRSLLKRVDDALYSVKESGRNRVALL
ncbi:MULTISPECIES: GGDEF domain-containing protein [unclassified Thioalkalivibrio]|uniref:GGDEF domain-containing protein n=1 Tax=unclassified Thioalkalivibrio TaxID=2621013 RepID=UPI00210107F9|nr:MULTISPECIES: GGDEF domain-containing protein [unclassified Thioalkalivibrio]